MITPVPNRVCGSCTVCCKVLPISEPELKKPPGVLCQHCLPDQGCQLRENWPKLCGEFFCGWRYYAQLDDNWRPDRSDILIEFKDKDVPPGFQRNDYFCKFTFFGRADKAHWEPLINFIANLVALDRPVMIATTGETPGHLRGQILVNYMLRPAILARDAKRIGAGLEQALAACNAHPSEKIHLQ
jgi:hypothetical protein